jgi:nuclear receptor co-repressor 1
MNVMKNRLVNLFKKSRDRYMCRTKFESEKYDQNYEQWQKSIEKDEKLILAKDISTYRETFEKTFPEIRKTREDKEKKQPTQTTNDLSSTSTDQVPIPSNSNSIEQDNEGEEDYEKMRKSSIIPPIMYDSWQRKHQYFNQNNFIQGDAAAFYKESSKMPYWSPEEKQIFIEKFTQSPKNFGYISSFLENKTTEQCVQFYYMTKKTENYKNLLRKQSQANRRRAKQNTTTTMTSSTTIETTLVTKVTMSNTIVSSTSQQILGLGQVCLIETSLFFLFRCYF